MRLGVVGGRNWKNRKLLWKHLDAWLKMYPKLHIVSGGAADGADNLAEKWARMRGVSFTIHPAKWRKEDGTVDKGAGFARNGKIPDDCEVMLAFWDFASNGTADTLTKARWHEPKIKFYVINPLGKVFAGEEVWGGKAGPEYNS